MANATSSNPRGANVTLAQKTHMLEFIEDHPNLKTGKFNNEFTVHCSRKLWEELSIELNSIPGANKTWNMWRKAYHDMRTKLKKKASFINVHRSKTGGGEKCNLNLTDFEIKLQEAMGSTVISGQESTMESKCRMDFDDTIEGGFQLFSDVIEFEDTTPPMAAPPLMVHPQNLTHTQKIFHNNDVPPSKKSFPNKKMGNTNSAAEVLADIAEKKLKLKEKYMEAKIELMKENIKIKSEFYNQIIELKKNKLSKSNAPNQKLGI